MKVFDEALLLFSCWKARREFREVVHETLSKFMHSPLSNGPPSPEEFQKQLSEFMRRHFQTSSAPPPSTKPEDDSSGPDEADQADEVLNFDRKPRDVKAYLDRFVIKQEEAKKVLSVALWMLDLEFWCWLLSCGAL